jgi:hypothetical protein
MFEVYISVGDSGWHCNWMRDEQRSEALSKSAVPNQLYGPWTEAAVTICSLRKGPEGKGALWGGGSRGFLSFIRMLNKSRQPPVLPTNLQTFILERSIAQLQRANNRFRGANRCLPTMFSSVRRLRKWICAAICTKTSNRKLHLISRYAHTYLPWVFNLWNVNRRLCM